RACTPRPHGVQARRLNWARRVRMGFLTFALVAILAITGCGGGREISSGGPDRSSASSRPSTNEPPKAKSNLFARNESTKPPPQPTIRLNSSNGAAKASFEVLHLRPEDLTKLAKADWTREQWVALFGVHVDEGTLAFQADQPALLGQYHIDQKML